MTLSTSKGTGSPSRTPSKDAIATPKGSFWTPGKIWLALLLFRLANALSIRTFFQPDEYFQSLEPAWQIAFGKESGAWITWEWHHQLRSSLHPVFFAAVYFVTDQVSKVLQFSTHTQAYVIAIVPNLAQAVISATGDFYTWRLAGKIYGEGSNSELSALAITILSPWQWFCSTRTFSNCLETTLTITALYYWPRGLLKIPDIASRAGPSQPKNTSKNRGAFTPPGAVIQLRVSLVLAATACILRPTNLLIWFAIVMPVALTLLSSQTRLDISEYVVLIREAIICGSFVLVFSAVSDKLYFQEWTFPPYQWLNFNVSQDLAVFYGRNDWHYYLSQGLPLLLTTILPFTLVALWRSTSPQDKSATILLTSAVLVTIGALSIISHKEVRFIYPLLPILHVISAPVVSSYFLESKPTSSGVQKSTSGRNTIHVKWKSLAVVLMLLNVIIAGYTSLVHQRGVLDVLTFLRNDFEGVAAKGSIPEFSVNETFVGFLMPCHSTPWRSKLVYSDLKAWALGCEPPIHLAARTEEREEYRDEADRFYDDPLRFLKTEIHTKDKPWPRYIAGFAGVEGVLKQHVLEEMKGINMKERWRGKNSDWHDDSRRVGDVIVWEFVTDAKL